MQGYLTFGSESGDAHLLQLPVTRFTFGSDERMDLVLAAQGVPSYCGSLVWNEDRGTWTLETDASARSSLRLNGMPVVQPSLHLENGAILSCGASTMRFDLVPDVPMLGNTPLRVLPLTGEKIRIGRGNEEGDATKIVLDVEDGAVSRHHATLTRESGGHWFIEDHSESGTDLNGRPFHRERLVIGDRFRIGQYVFEFTGRSLRRLLTSSGGRIEGRQLTRVVPDGRRILNEVSVEVTAGSFVGLLGGSGQGKSTLMKALCGLTPPTTGQVLLDGQLIGTSATAGDTAGRIGYVPQDDIVHTDLTVREAITFSARLRLPDRPTPEQIDELVLQTAGRLSLEPHLHKRVSKLSGGQRKRVSIATELLAKPAVLFLDEPSSGLDPANEAYLMTLLRELAGVDCTVVCTTHVLAKAHLFDRIAFVQSGRMVFYGLPSDAKTFFGHEDLHTIYIDLDQCNSDEGRSAEEWEREYLASPLRPVTTESVPLAHDQGAAPPAPRPGAWSTLRTLLARQWSILKADKLNLAFLLAQALAIAALIGWVAESASLRSFLSVVAVLWFGCSNAAQEIVRELPIFLRERVCGLGLNVYVCSKVLFTLLVTVLQTMVLWMTVTLTAAITHPAPMDMARLLRDERLAGPPIPATGTDTEPSGSGYKNVGRTFGFNKAQALEIAVRFALPGDKKNLDGTPLVDDAAIIHGVDTLLGEIKTRGLDPRSDAARNLVLEKLKPQPPPPSQAPNFLYREFMCVLIRLFGLNDNVLDSESRLIMGLDKEPLQDPVTKKVLKFDALPLSQVVLRPVVLQGLALMGAGLAGVALGLAISALVRSQTQAVMWVPLILIPQILFGGFVITRPEMSAAVRALSTFAPSAAAQRIAETAAVHGQSVPRITNRTRIPVFVRAKTYRTVTWTEGGKELSEDYSEPARISTALQNLIVNVDIVGQRPIAPGTTSEEGKKADEVESRADVEPYRTGTLLTDLRPAWNAGGVLLLWVVLSYLTTLHGLRCKKPD